MLAATFLAIFFVPWFFRVLVDRRLQERRSVEDLRQKPRKPMPTRHE
jgi:hypothetical protein